MVMRMEADLARLHATRPVVANFIAALRTLAYCCPTSGNMYVPLTTSIFAQPGSTDLSAHSRLAEQGARSRAGSAVGDLPRANAVLLAREAAEARSRGLTDSQACTWLQTRWPVKKGEELFDSRRVMHACTWPGFKRG